MSQFRSLHIATLFCSHLTSRVVSPHPEECIPENTNDSVCGNELKVESVSDPDFLRIERRYFFCRMIMRK